MKQENHPKQTLGELCRQQQMIITHYNQFATLCRGIPLRNQVLDFLQEEHQLHGQLLAQLLERGLVQYDLATKEEVEQIKRDLKENGIG